MTDMHHKSTRGTWFYAAIGAAAGLAWGVLSIVLLYFTVPSTRAVFPNPRNSLSGNLPTLRAESPDYATIDGILSIIQTYYVDAERSRLDDLLSAAVWQLHLRHDFCKLRDAGDLLLLTVGEREFEIPKKVISYHEVVEKLAAIAGEIDAVHLRSKAKRTLSARPSGVLTVVNAMLRSLDAHSALLSTDAYRELRQGTEGAFGGLGVLVGIRDRVLTVIKPLPHSPAARAGIQRLDKILHINDVSTYGYDLDELVDYMRGEPGTPVAISVLRDGDQAPVEMILNREVISVDSVESHVEKTDSGVILHLVVENFAMRTAQEVWSAIQRARRDSGGELAGLILDLRSNPGGLLDQAVQLSDLFLEKGTIVSTKGRRTEVEAADDGYAETNFPLMVLINSDTASASEIVSGALQDHNRGLVIGQPSFGKGSVQTIFELPGERALKLTVARYYTPAERSIQNVGIYPDIWLQPVYRSDTNVNMLGTTRYRGEQFLENHLNRGGNDTLPTTPYSKLLLGYSLQDRLDESGFSQPRQDDELALAKMIIEQVRAKYPHDLPASARRASHWLTVASESVTKKLARYSSEAGAFLQKEFGIDWGDYGVQNGASLSLKIEKTDRHLARPGSLMPVKYELRNQSKQMIGRISIVARSFIGSFESQEFLVGAIPPESSKLGIVRVRVPMHIDRAGFDLHFGMAIDAVPRDETLATVPVSLDLSGYSEVGAELEIVSEVGGSISGVLEPNELAVVRLTVVNQGMHDLNNLKLNILNLAGKQVNVESRQKDIPSIPAGERRRVDVGIAAGPSISSTRLEFGVEIVGDNLVAPVHQSLVVKSHPNFARKQLSITGH